MRIQFIKKCLVLTTAALSVSVAYVGPMHATEAPASPDYLQIIATNTTTILERVSTLPNYIVKMLEYALNMQKEDDSQSTLDMQANFATIGQLMQQNYVTQNNGQVQLTADLIGQPAGGFALAADNTASVLKAFPNVNDLAYATMIGLPPAARGAANPYNYIKNASGINLYHVQPVNGWAGQPDALKAYSAYYNTVLAIESFNAYALSGQYADFQNGNTLTNTQLNLVTQASSSDWIANIASEEIGKVLRQLLIFQSQTYVLMTQIAQTQKQLLTAQVMTNTAIIAANTKNETDLVKSAKR